MKNLLIPAVVCTALGVAALGSYVGGAQQQPAKPAPSADPYANNPDPGTQKFPLAAPAGKDSGARTAAPAGASTRDRSIRPPGSTARHSTRLRARRSGIPSS